jgi:hypothetical protein
MTWNAGVFTVFEIRIFVVLWLDLLYVKVPTFKKMFRIILLAYFSM